MVKNARSLLYVGNLADAIITCIQHPNAAGQTFLVSDGEDISTPELIRRIAHALNRPARLLPFLANQGVRVLEVVGGGTKNRIKYANPSSPSRSP